MIQQASRPIMGTLFRDMFAQQGEPLSLQQWIRLVQSDEWKDYVVQGRLLIASGRADEARDIKKARPMFVCNATCLTGRANEQFTARNPTCMIDCDEHDLEWSNSKVQEALCLPCVVGAYVSFSGGVRLFVNVGNIHPTRWKMMYDYLAGYFDGWFGKPVDRACNNLIRASLASYDPNAWCRDLEETIPFHFPGNLALDEPLTEPLPSPSQLSPMLAHPTREPGAADPGFIIDHFFQKHTFVQGERNRTIFTLGAWARYFRLTPQQLDGLGDLAVGRCAQPGFTEKEIRQALRNGYNHGTEGPSCAPVYTPKDDGPTPTKGSFLGSEVYSNPQNVKNRPLFADIQQYDDSPDDTDEDRLIDDTCPTFPDEIFDRLPTLLRRGLEIARTKRERDMLLMAMLTNLSGCLPKVRVNYANRIYSAHLYFGAVSPAGSGKGIVNLASKLGSKVNRLMKDRYIRAKRTYQHDLITWENEKKHAFKEHREPNWELEPAAPIRQLLLFPPNTSKSQMILDLEASLHIGMIMNTSEIDAFTAALNTDYGQHTSEIRMIYHHEEVGLNYKTDGRMIVVDQPRMAICTSGTLEQLVHLVGNLEDGTFSRFLFLTAPSIDTWLSAEPSHSMNSADAVFDELAEEVNEIFNYFNGGQEYHITFTHDQWLRHTRVFGHLLTGVTMESEGSAKAIVGRHGLGAIRMATVLSALRIYEDSQHFSPYICSDNDFDIILRMSEVLIRHAKQLSTIIPRISKRRTMSRFDKLKHILLNLPVHFSYTDFIRRAIESGRSESWAKRGIRTLITKAYIAKTQKGYKKLK